MTDAHSRGSGDVKSESSHSDCIRVVLVIVALMPVGAVSAGQEDTAPNGLGLAFGVGYVVVDGERFEGAELGFGFGAALRYAKSSGLEFRVAGSYSSHRIDLVDSAIKSLMFHVEGRYVQTSTVAIAPFIGVLLGVGRVSLESQGINATAVGPTFGAVGGLLFQIAETTAFETGLTWTMSTYGDAKVEGVTIAGTSATGTLFGLYVGFAFTFRQ